MAQTRIFLISNGKVVNFCGLPKIQYGTEFANTPYSTSSPQSSRSQSASASSKWAKERNTPSRNAFRLWPCTRRERSQSKLKPSWACTESPSRPCSRELSNAVMSSAERLKKDMWSHFPGAVGLPKHQQRLWQLQPRLKRKAELRSPKSPERKAHSH